MNSPSSPAASSSATSAAQQQQQQVPQYMFHHHHHGTTSPTWNTAAANSSSVYTPPMLQSSGETSPYHQSLSAPGNSIATGEGNYAGGSGFLPPTPNSAVTTVGPNSGNSNDGHGPTAATSPTTSQEAGQSVAAEANHQLAALAQNNLYSHWATSGASQGVALRAPPSLSPPTDLRNGSGSFLGLTHHHHAHHHPYMNNLAPFTHHQQSMGQYAAHKGYGMGHQQFNPWY